MTYRVLVCIGALALVGRTSSAQDSTASACWHTAMTQASLTQCAGTDLRTSRNRLQRLIRELRATLDSAALPGFDRTQARWEAYARAQCDWEGAAYDGGSMRPMIEAGCFAHEVEQRIAALKLFLCGWDNQTPRCDAAKKYDLPASTRGP